MLPQITINPAPEWLFALGGTCKYLSIVPTWEIIAPQPWGFRTGDAGQPKWNPNALEMSRSKCFLAGKAVAKSVEPGPPTVPKSLHGLPEYLWAAP